MQKKEFIPSLLILVMGLIDCLTTIIGVVYSGAKELNPFMAGIVSTNVGAFLVIKITATVFISLTYIFSKHLIMQLPKNGKTFSYSSKMLKFAYGGLIAFLAITVANNLLILIK